MRCLVVLVVSCLVESQGKSVLVGGLDGRSAASFAFIKASQDRPETKGAAREMWLAETVE